MCIHSSFPSTLSPSQKRLVEFFQIKVQGALRQSKVGLLSTMVFMMMGMGKVNKAMATGTTNHHQQQTTTMRESTMRNSHGGESKSMDRKVQVEMSVSASAKDHHSGMVEDIVGRATKPTTSIHAHSGHSHHAHSHTASKTVVKHHSSSDAKKQKHGIRQFFSFQRELQNIETEAKEQVEGSVKSLLSSLSGAKQDTLLMLMATSVIIPIFKRFNLSPILGFLAMGTLMGHAGGLNYVYDQIN